MALSRSDADTIREVVSRLRAEHAEREATAIERLMQQALSSPDSMVALAGYMTTGEAAGLIGVSLQTIKNWVRQERLVGTRVGGRTLVTRASVQAFFDSLSSAPEQAESDDAAGAEVATVSCRAWKRCSNGPARARSSLRQTDRSFGDWRMRGRPRRRGAHAVSFLVAGAPEQNGEWFRQGSGASSNDERASAANTVASAAGPSPSITSCRGRPGAGPRRRRSSPMISRISPPRAGSAMSLASTPGCTGWTPSRDWSSHCFTRGTIAGVTTSNGPPTFSS